MGVRGKAQNKDEALLTKYEIFRSQLQKHKFQLRYQD
jgi:hypothetical protein